MTWLDCTVESKAYYLRECEVGLVKVDMRKVLSFLKLHQLLITLYDNGTNLSAH
jgi:hypothetical protein